MISLKELQVEYPYKPFFKDSFSVYKERKQMFHWKCTETIQKVA